MEENKVETTEDGELNLDTDAIWERQDYTTSSVAYLNKIPVFSDTFRENREMQEKQEEETKQMVLGQMFYPGEIDYREDDVRMYLFGEKDTELIIHNQAVQFEEKTIYQLAAVFAIIGIFVACTAWIYKKKGTKENNVNNQHQKPVRQ